MRPIARLDDRGRSEAAERSTQPDAAAEAGFAAFLAAIPTPVASAPVSGGAPTLPDARGGQASTQSSTEDRPRDSSSAGERSEPWSSSPPVPATQPSEPGPDLRSSLGTDPAGRPIVNAPTPTVSALAARGGGESRVLAIVEQILAETVPTGRIDPDSAVLHLVTQEGKSVAIAVEIQGTRVTVHLAGDSSVLAAVDPSALANGLHAEGLQLAGLELAPEVQMPDGEAEGQTSDGGEANVAEETTRRARRLRRGRIDVEA